jgi:hypothetical protein
MVGVGVQEFFIAVFIVLAGRFQYQMAQMERVRPIPHHWRRLLYTLYIALGLITVRIIFRLAEYPNGEHSHVAMHEAYFYCLEALPMIASLVMFNVLHPALVLIGPDSEFPKKVKKSRAERKIAKEKRKVQRNYSSARGARYGVDVFGTGRDMDGIEMRV